MGIFFGGVALSDFSAGKFISCAFGTGASVFAVLLCVLKEVLFISAFSAFLRGVLLIIEVTLYSDFEPSTFFVPLNAALSLSSLIMDVTLKSPLPSEASPSLLTD